MVALDDATARGWPVSLVRPSAKKPPVFQRWPTRASTDPARIHGWWEKDRPANSLSRPNRPGCALSSELPEPRHCPAHRQGRAFVAQTHSAPEDVP
ncbi:bifunctional DNA primase/polymerase [Nocardia sp. NPDC047038]|uniref:bifunctional DNA primase/polymerase n=1 Tax=Nocardia sp. NPDC047038 TaxID=3154338 RepID=UPI0033D3B157